MYVQIEERDSMYVQIEEREIGEIGEKREIGR